MRWKTAPVSGVRISEKVKFFCQKPSGAKPIKLFEFYADAERKKIVVLGVANLCASKWDDKDFKLKIIAEEIKSTLAQCGMVSIDLGHTYLADRMSDLGLPIQSSLDHIYRNINPQSLSLSSMNIY